MTSHSKLTYQLLIQIVSRKTDYHAGGKWFIHGPRRCKENRLLILYDIWYISLKCAWSWSARTDIALWVGWSGKPTGQLEPLVGEANWDHWSGNPTGQLGPLVGEANWVTGTPGRGSQLGNWNPWSGTPTGQLGPLVGEANWATGTPGRGRQLGNWNIW